MASNPTADAARLAAQTDDPAQAYRILVSARDSAAQIAVSYLLEGHVEVATVWAEHAAVADARVGMLLDPRPAVSAS